VSDETARAGIAPVLWIGGAQWAGKTTVARLLTARHPLLLYAYDYHDARDHYQRALAHPERYPHRAAWLARLARDPDTVWSDPTPEEMAADATRSFIERFDMVLDDLRAMPPGPPILAEGWGLRPALVAPLLDSPAQAVFLVPTEAFRQQQIRTMERAGQFTAARVRDPERAQRNRIERDRILSQDVIDSAHRLGLNVIEVDGSRPPADIAAGIEQQFRPFLPRWLY
jgi:hypothetical protein